MKVRIVNPALLDGAFRYGEVIDVSDAQGSILVKMGHAVPHFDAPPAPPPLPTPADEDDDG